MKTLLAQKKKLESKISNLDNQILILQGKLKKLQEEKASTKNRLTSVLQEIREELQLPVRSVSRMVDQYVEPNQILEVPHRVESTTIIESPATRFEEFGEIESVAHPVKTIVQSETGDQRRARRRRELEAQARQEGRRPDRAASSKLMASISNTYNQTRFDPNDRHDRSAEVS